jgi:hypothetical protein
VTTPPYAVLEAARRQAAMSVEELWIAYFALGGRAQPDEVRAYLGGAAVDSMDYDVLAQAINEHFIDQGANHPVPYRDELVQGSQGPQ